MTVITNRFATLFQNTYFLFLNLPTLKLICLNYLPSFQILELNIKFRILCHLTQLPFIKTIFKSRNISNQKYHNFKAVHTQFETGQGTQLSMCLPLIRITTKIQRKLYKHELMLLFSKYCKNIKIHLMFV